MEVTQNIICIEKRRKCNGSAVIRIDGEAANILGDFAAKTGLSYLRLASNFIKFASENTIVIEDKEGEMKV